MKIHALERFQGLPDAIFFDMDNTFYPYEPAHKAALAAVQGKISAMFSISTGQFDNLFEEARREVKGRLNSTASSHSRLLYMQRLFELLGLGSQPMYSLDMEQTYWRAFLTHAVLFDGLREFLDDARLLGIPMVVVTDLTAQIQFRKLIYFNLDSFFQYVITSEEVSSDKPHPSPFLLALEKCQPPKDNIWMIGDSPVNDILGARKAIGATTLQKIHPGIQPGSGDCSPDAAFSQFADLRKLLLSLGRQ